MKPQTSIQTRRRQKQSVCLAAFALLIAALCIRFYHDRIAQKAVPQPLGEAERRARENPSDLQAALDYGNALYNAKRKQEAIAIFARAAQLNPRDARAYVWLGILAEQDQRPDIARANFQQAIQINPANVEVWQALGELFVHASAYREAITTYQRVTRLQPENAIAWRQLGMLETRQSLLARGYEDLKKSVALAPRDTLAQKYFGENCLAQGLLPEAKSAFEAAASHHNDDPVALSGLAIIALQTDPSSEGLMRAEHQAQRAVAISPDGQTHLALGRVYLAQRRYQAAIKEFHAAVVHQSNESSAYVYLSQAYAAIGKPALARQASARYEKTLAASQQRKETGRSPAAGAFR